MKFRVYANRAEMERDRATNGADMQLGDERTGQMISSAPGGFWVLPWTRRPDDPKTAWLVHRNSTGVYWAARSEQTYV